MSSDTRERNAQLRAAASLQRARYALALNDFQVACPNEWRADAVLASPEETRVFDVINQTNLLRDDIVILSDGHCYSRSGMRGWLTANIAGAASGRVLLPTTRHEATDDDYRAVGLEAPTTAQLSNAGVLTSATLLANMAAGAANNDADDADDAESSDGFVAEESDDEDVVDALERVVKRGDMVEALRLMREYPVLEQRIVSAAFLHSLTRGADAVQPPVLLDFFNLVIREYPGLAENGGAFPVGLMADLYRDDAESRRWALTDLRAATKELWNVRVAPARFAYDAGRYADALGRENLPDEMRQLLRDIASSAIREQAQPLMRHAIQEFVAGMADAGNEEYALLLEPQFRREVDRLLSTATSQSRQRRSIRRAAPY